MNRHYSVFGNIALDYHCKFSFSINNNRVDFQNLHPPLFLETKIPIFNGGKLTLKVPVTDAELHRLFGAVVPGGGGLGTVSSLRGLVNSKIRYIDVSVPKRIFTRHFDSIDVNYHFFNLRRAPVNLVLGHRSNKIILKSYVQPVAISRAVYSKIVELLTCSEWIILNSVKDTAVAEAAIEASLRTQHCKVAVVLTTSLEPEYIQRRILPSAHILIVSFDELEWLLPGLRADITSSRERLLRLFNDSRINASFFITLGRQGVLCGSRDGFFHVRLRDEVAQQVDCLINRYPAAITGAGDFLSGGIVANRSGHMQSQVPGYPQVVHDAIAGSIAAIKHLGQQVNYDDFIVYEDIWCEYKYYGLVQSIYKKRERDREKVAVK